MNHCIVDPSDRARSAPAAHPGAATATLVLVRHGETSWNRSRKIQGHLDIGLNPTGVEQARATARALAEWPIAAVHSSDLVRALHTAEAIAAPHGLPVVAEPALRERHWGRFQGLRFDEIVRDHPDVGPRITERDPQFVPEGGESIAELDVRVRAVVHRLARQATGRVEVVVTHGGVLDAIYRIATGLDLSSPRSFSLTNAAINVVDLTSSGWSVRFWGEVAHLAAIEQRDELG